MARSPKGNGAVVGSNGKGQAQVLKLSSRRFSRASFDAFAHDFCTLAEVAADDVYHGRISVQLNNSARGQYSNILRMIDLQMRARKMGLVKPKNKFLNP